MSRFPRSLARAYVAAVCLLFLGLAPVGKAGTSATLTYPGCGASLQACMNDSNQGDTILIATNDPIVQEISIPHGLHVKAAEGFDPVFGAEVGSSPSFGASYIPGAGTHEITIEGIRFVRTEVAILFNGGSDHSVILRHNQFDRTNARVQAISDGTFAVVNVYDNTFDTGQAQINGAPFEKINIRRNHFFATDPLVASGAIDVRPTGEANKTVIANNLIHDMGGCNCGSNGGILVLGYAASTKAYVLNNTVDSLIVPENYSATGIHLSGEDLRAFVFNNTVSHTSGGIGISAGVTAGGSGNNTYKTKGNSLSGQPVDVSHEPPQFMDPSSDDYRLQSGSFLRNRGSACVPSMALPRADLQSNFRFAGKTVDIGALEKGSTIDGDVAGQSRVGTAANDTFNGTAGVDVFCGMGGADTLTGSLDGDYLFGGKGPDKIRGGEGPDRLHGNKGSDDVGGGTSADHLYLKDGVQGNDKGDGGGGNDSCTADPGDTVVNC